MAFPLLRIFLFFFISFSGPWNSIYPPLAFFLLANRLSDCSHHSGIQVCSLYLGSFSHESWQRKFLFSYALFSIINSSYRSLNDPRIWYFTYLVRLINQSIESAATTSLLMFSRYYQSHGSLGLALQNLRRSSDASVRKFQVVWMCSELMSLWHTRTVCVINFVVI